MKRKGQGAMEYLMTYSWAILVVMLVGIALWQLGILKMGGVTSTTSSGFPRIKPQLSLTAVKTDGSLTAIFTNGAGPVKLVDIIGTCDFTNGYDTTSIISQGDNFVITAIDCETGGGGVGDPYEVVMTIVYNVTFANYNVQHSDMGSLRGPLELTS